MASIFYGDFRLPDDRNDKVNQEALPEACDAQTEFQDARTTLDSEPTTSARWGRYYSLMGKSLRRRDEAAFKALPNLQLEQEEAGRLLDLANNTATEKTWQPSDPSSQAFRRADKKQSEIWDKIETTLKRLCSPPVA